MSRHLGDVFDQAADLLTLLGDAVLTDAINLFIQLADVLDECFFVGPPCSSCSGSSSVSAS